jgi:hypothetical protein
MKKEGTRWGSGVDRVAALSHELFHASDRFGLKDLWLPEETQAFRHTLRTTAKLGISIPAVEQYAGLLYIAPIALCVFLISLVPLAHGLRPDLPSSGRLWSPQANSTSTLHGRDRHFPRFIIFVLKGIGTMDLLHVDSLSLSNIDTSASALTRGQET